MEHRCSDGRNKVQKFRKRLFEIVEIGAAKDKVSIAFDGLISLLIIINILVTILLTFNGLEKIYPVLNVIETVTIVIFTVEYIARIATADFKFPDKKMWKSIVRFIFSFYGIVDLLSFAPFYLPFFTPTGVAVFRLLRVVRIFRLFQINAQFDAFNIIVEVIKDKSKQLLSSVVLILMFMLASSLMMYSVENAAQPEVFENALSGLWWSMATIFTIGYGDITPVTAVGKLLGVVISFLGVGMVAIPTGIISAGFVEQFAKVSMYKGHGEGHELEFVTSYLAEGHPWCNQKVEDIVLPPQSLLVMIVRGDEEILMPKGDTSLLINDRLVIAAKNYKDEDIHLNQVEIKDGDTWIGLAIKDLELSSNEMVVNIKRGRKSIIPNGRTVIQKDDVLLMYHID